MTAPRFVLVKMGEYEECLAAAQREYRRLRDARTATERDAARADYDRAIAHARDVGARLARELDAAAAGRAHAA